jgi:hypothetical protein
LIVENEPFNLKEIKRKEFGNGVLWAVATIAFGMGFVYAIGNTPNPGILMGTTIFGLWYRFKEIT